MKFKKITRELTIDLQPGESPEQIKQQFKVLESESIFNHTQKDGWLYTKSVKFHAWLFDTTKPKLLWLSTNFIVWHIKHRFIKQYILHPLLRLTRWLASKTLVTSLDQIKERPWNNLLRIWYHNREKAIEDVWRVWNYKQSVERGKVPRLSPSKKVEYAKTYKGNRSYMSRKTWLDMEATLVTQDTADKARIESELLRNCHTLMQHFGVSQEERKKVPDITQIPLYISSMRNDPGYFIHFRNSNVWQPPEHDLVELKMDNDYEVLIDEQKKAEQERKQKNGKGKRQNRAGTSRKTKKGERSNEKRKKV